jgi:hypothetical protein
MLDILLMVDGIHTLVDVVIADPVWAYLVLHVDSYCGVVAIVIAQAKDFIMIDTQWMKFSHLP